MSLARPFHSLQGEVILCPGRHVPQIVPGVDFDDIAILGNLGCLGKRFDSALCTDFNTPSAISRFDRKNNKQAQSP